MRTRAVMRGAGNGLAAVLLAATGACGSSQNDDAGTTAPQPTITPITQSPTTTPTTQSPTTATQSPKAPASGSPTADPWAAKIAKWEKENAISTSDWYNLVTGKTVKSNLLRIETKISDNADAEVAANPICGAYSTIVFEYAELDTVTVRTAQGTEAFRCGPGR